MTTRPVVGADSPPIVKRSVDLPLPLAPTTDRSSPCPMVRLTPSSAWTMPPPGARKVLPTSLTSIMLRSP